MKPPHAAILLVSAQPMSRHCTIAFLGKQGPCFRSWGFACLQASCLWRSTPCNCSLHRVGLVHANGHVSGYQHSCFGGAACEHSCDQLNAGNNSSSSLSMLALRGCMLRASNSSGVVLPSPKVLRNSASLHDATLVSINPNLSISCVVCSARGAELPCSLFILQLLTVTAGKMRLVAFRKTCNGYQKTGGSDYVQ